MSCKSLFLALAAVCGLSAQNLVAQMTANVPFPFELQGKTFAAGSYEVQRNTSPDLMTLRNTSTGETVMALVVSRDTKPNGKNALIFEKTGGVYYFRTIVEESSGLAYNAPKSRRQAETAKLHTPEKVFIAAR